jgi:GntR family L-lactate dehydrogenase operon transcriptional regulator
MARTYLSSKPGLDHLGGASADRKRRATNHAEQFWLSTDLEHRILELLEGTRGGVGSGSIFLRLRDQGFEASQATVGRVLRVLDHQGMTTKVSNRGRVLTPAGKRFLEELRRREGRKEWAEQLLTDAEPASRDEFLKVLAALRLLEGHIASLAAENASPEQIDTLWRTLEAQREQLESPGMGADQGIDLHELIAEAAGNRFLRSATNLIWSSNKSIRDLWYEANILTGISSYPDHIRIIKAIANKDPRRAKHAMDVHFDRFVGAVRSFLVDGKKPRPSRAQRPGKPQGSRDRGGPRRTVTP